ncbi:YtxH domain-containing protein [Alteribacter aurantiacus]|uniref:YtxH domain-containing protein n=1 Tax=Alteribacter aurantiacus TaxID=254410 RepID=UPI000404BB74|nr:YtxH domain-containing protein [Alteribacter aurantiacus]
MGKGIGIGFAFGTAAAGITALLVAPKSGTALRYRLRIRYYEQRKKLDDLIDEIKLETSRLEEAYESVKAHIASEMDAVRQDAIDAAHDELRENNG